MIINCIANSDAYTLSHLVKLPLVLLELPEVHMGLKPIFKTIRTSLQHASCDMQYDFNIIFSCINVDTLQ